MKHLQFATIKNNLAILKKTYQYDRPLFFLRILMALLTSISVYLSILMPMYVLNAILEGSFSHIISYTVVFTVALLIISYLNQVFAAYDKIHTEVIFAKVTEELLHKSATLDLSYFDDTASYDKYNRAFSNCCNVINGINRAVSSFVTAIANIILISQLLAWMNPFMFVMITLSISINLIINNRLKKRDYELSKKLSEKNKQLNYIYRLFYLPHYIKEIKTNRLESFIFNQKQGFNKASIDLVTQNANGKLPFTLSLTTINVVESSMVALYFGFSVMAKQIAMSQYFTYVNAYSQLKNTILNLSAVYNQLYSNSLFAEDYIDFLNTDQHKTLNLDGQILDTVACIEFRDVSFHYPNTTSLALNHVSFSISAGESVAIVGRNGAGKTTIIKLLLRLYEPTSGEIHINGTNIKEYNTESLRNTICALFQDYALFAFSIRDNIELGKTEPPDCIWSALEQVELKDKVNTLPHAYDTPITSQLYADGIELSGGESQKLAISRIYAHNAQVIAMDEPTSSLDPKSEFTLYQQILNNTKPNAIVIIVSHRLTLTYKMSKIIVLEHGRIKEQGTHSELVNRKGIYKELYDMQATKYTTDKKF